MQLPKSFQARPEPKDSLLWRKVIRYQKRGLRCLMTMACGHTADGVHEDSHIPCLTCADIRARITMGDSTLRHFRAILQCVACEAVWDISDMDKQVSPNGGMLPLPLHAPGESDPVESARDVCRNSESLTKIIICRIV